MSMSEYPEDIQTLARAAAFNIDGDGAIDPGFLWRNVEEGIAEAIHQERKRCGELAYAHALYNPACEGAVALHLDIMNGKRA